MPQIPKFNEYVKESLLNKDSIKSLADSIKKFIKALEKNKVKQNFINVDNEYFNLNKKMLQKVSNLIDSNKLVGEFDGLIDSIFKITANDKEIAAQDLSEGILNEGVIKLVLLKAVHTVAKTLVSMAHKMHIFGEILVSILPYLVASLKMFINSPDVHKLIDIAFDLTSNNFVYMTCSWMLAYIASAMFEIVEKYSEYAIVVELQTEAS